ncbi:NgoFVII family restriction endonuclease [bacterium]|nr:NgoFVII family restriction endonuclease [bacterium]
MLFYSNLEEIIFHRHEMVQSDELIILSGYVGPNPILRLQTLPFNSRIIYGMYGSDGIRRTLHNSLVSINNAQTNIQIFYSRTPVHSKCYIWKYENRIVHALVGSANFSSNGLSTPYRETLAETTVDTFIPLNDYVETILRNSIICTDAVVTEGRRNAALPEDRETDYCRMTLLDPRTNEMQNANGLNWGQNPDNHTNPNDANIPIRAEYIRLYPELFPPKQELPRLSEAGGRAQRHNDTIEIIWDDGATMEGLLEGNYPVNGVIYPKQISSFPEKRHLGSYIRQRIGVADGARVTRRHLERYGRTHIDVSLQTEGVYFFNFSV